MVRSACIFARVKVFQSFIGEHQKSFLSPGASPWDAAHNGAESAREYELFRSIQRDDPEARVAPWGLVSWKFQHKCGVPLDAFSAFAEAQLNHGFDCAFINPMIGAEALYQNVWEQGAHTGHKGMDRLAIYLASRLGGAITAPMGRDSFAFCNYFVATPAFWQAYFAFVDSAIGMLEAQVQAATEVGAIYGGSAHYARDRTVSMRPFVIERLFSCFVQGSTFRCAAYPFGMEHYRAKFGAQLGTFLRRLSDLKREGIAAQDRQLLQRWESIRLNILTKPYRGVVFNLDDPNPYFISPEFPRDIL